MRRPQKIKAEHYEVVIIGGGMSGLCAALSASRHGAKTALIQDRPVFGGNASGEIRMHICGASENGKKPDLEEGGILYELMLENKYRNDYFNYSVWDMVLFQAVKEQKNLTAYLNTVMEDCTVADDIVQSVSCYQQTTEIRYEISGDIFIDCSGNATLGYLSGAEFRTGSEGKREFGEKDAPQRPDNNRMGNTLLFKAVKRNRDIAFYPPRIARHFTEQELKYRPHSAVHTKDRASADYLRLTSFSASAVDYGYWWCELSGKDPDIVDDYESIRDDLVSCVWGIWDHLKNGGDHLAQKYDIDWVGMLPGMRESRRLVGDYMLNENDILSNREFSDAVAYGGWAMDIHTANGLYDFDKRPSTIITFPGTYTIPYRSYYSKNIRNLLMAGRNISVSKMALGSTRVMGTCAIGGQAAGTAAALCRKYHCFPGGIRNHIGELQQLLLKDDCYIPGIRNTDEGDLAREAKISAGSERPGYPCTNITNGISRAVGKEHNLWMSKGISPQGETVQLDFEKCRTVSEIRLTFDSNFRYAIKITLSDKRRKQQRKGVPKELVSDYTITCWNGKKAVKELNVSGNYERLNVHTFAPVSCDRITVCVTKTNGDRNARIYEIRVYGPEKHAVKKEGGKK
jgi:hypothetical protein